MSKRYYAMITETTSDKYGVSGTTYNAWCVLASDYAELEEENQRLRQAVEARIRKARRKLSQMTPAFSNISERNADGSTAYRTAVWLPDVLHILDAVLEEK